MNSRWPGTEAAPVIADPGPPGMVDLWNAVPAGAALSTTARAALAASNSTAIVGRYGALTQQAGAAVGIVAGYRPELMPGLAPMLERGLGAELAQVAALADRLDLGGLLLDNVVEPVVEQLENTLAAVGRGIGMAGAAVSWVPFLGQVAGVVAWTVSWVAKGIAADKDAAAAWERTSTTCREPVYSAPVDRATSEQAVRLLAEGDWTRMYLPEVRLRNPDAEPFPGMPQAPLIIGPTCCPSTRDRFSVVIAPIGVGLGNRIDSGLGGYRWPSLNPDGEPGRLADGREGLGCLPMLPGSVHRAIVYDRGRGTYDAGDELAELGCVGGIGWRLLWNRGPASWAVDAAALATAWREYLEDFILPIAENRRARALGGGYTEGVCRDWTPAKRIAVAEWMAARFGAPKEAAAADGIARYGALDDALPVRAWKDTATYQAAMLQRVAVAYADPRTCAPAWRGPVEQAQLDLLTSERVCEVELDAITDPIYRAAVFDEQRRRGVQCFTLADTLQGFKVGPTSGPSTEPLGSGSPELPELPELPKPERLGSSSSSSTSSTGWLVLGGVGLAVGGLAWLARNRRR